MECAHHVARAVAERHDGVDVHLIGFPCCYPNIYAQAMMERLCCHPNVGAVLLVSLGCESFARNRLLEAVRASGRPASLLVTQEEGGTCCTIARGRGWVAQTLPTLAAMPTVPLETADLVVGTNCGGSDVTSGLTANPAIGRAFNRLIAVGAAGIFEETGELIWCEGHLAARVVTPELGVEIVSTVNKAAR